MVLVDTTFLIDLQRMHQQRLRQAAVEWLRKNSNIELGISAIVYGEFAEGFSDPASPLLVQIGSSYRIVPVDLATAKIYGRVSRELRRRGESIGANDTWIAASAILHQRPLLTRNVKHFQRVPGLGLRSYE